MNTLRNNWYDIDVLSVSDATLHVIDDGHSQIESALRNMLIRWIIKCVMMHWINEDNERSESVLIEALRVMKENYLSHEN